MKKAMLIVAALVLAVSGCTTVQVNPLSHELSYQFTPTPDVEKSVDKSIAIVPFEDGRMHDGANKTESTSMLVNLVPLVLWTTGYVSHPEVEYNTTSVGICDYVKASGSMANALPKILAAYLGRSRRFSKATFVEYAEVKGSHSYDYVLRGTLVESDVVVTRLSYGLSVAAPAAYILGAPMAHYSASLTVDWQLYDAAGEPVGAKQTSTLEAPLTKTKGLYYGAWANQKTVPIGLYVEAIRTVNEQIADGVSELIRAQ